MSGPIHYRSSRAKLAWARAQMDILALEIADIVEQHRDVPMFDMDAQPGRILFIGPQSFELPDVLSAHAGRVIGAVRSALDNLVVQTVETADAEADTRFIVFPISGNPEKPGSDEWMTQKLGPLPATYRKALADFQPYRGGNDDLFALHELRKQDEHIAINMVALKRKGQMTMSRTTSVEIVKGPDGKERVERRVTDLGNQFETLVSVEFGEGTTAEGREVVPTISAFIALGEAIVERFESLSR